MSRSSVKDDGATVNKGGDEIEASSDLTKLPGGGAVTEYKSAAADFWRGREYRGLESRVGLDEVKGAIRGQTGIASEYHR